ncbi:MAG: fibronectin type III domain-containing protein [Jatrophihabitans sp.]
MRTIVPTIALAVLSVAVAVTANSGTQPAPRSRAADYTNRAPLGHLDTLVPSQGGVRTTGWAFDPDEFHSAVQMSISVDGHAPTVTTASASRSDVARAYPDAGALHGFSTFVPVGGGSHTICLTAKNLGPGSDHALGCGIRTIDYGPFGYLDTVSAGHGQLRVAGWAIDSDAMTAPVTTTITVDGIAHTVLANTSRPDVGTVYPHTGTMHGYDASLSVAQGTHTACVTAGNVGPGADKSFGCRSVTLNDSPLGYLDVAAQQAGTLRVRGWTFDPEQPTSALTVSITVDSAAPRNYTANAVRTDVAKVYPSAGPNHGYDQLITLAEGTHRVCVTAHNVGYGTDRVLPSCRTAALHFTPTASLTSLTATSTGVSFGGWATDPDTSAAISVKVTLDGATATTITARGPGSTYSGHNFSGALASRSGPHTVCAIALNALYGTSNSAPSCRSISLALSPLGYLDSLARSSGTLVATGWAADPDSASPTAVTVTLDGHQVGTYQAAAARPDVGRVYPSLGAARGYSIPISAGDGEHTVCVTAKNVSGGTDLARCKLIIAVHPTPPSAPLKVSATSGYNASVVSWTRPASDGGAPWTSYVVVASPGGKTVTTGPTSTSATVTGLGSNTSYTFTVRAVNVAGTSAAGTSPRITTQAGPPAQTTPAPISTSRYIRNVRGSSTAELALMRREGAADAAANPSNHKYLILLDIGGQNQAYSGVVLSATTRFVAYGDLVKDIQAYLDGYHSAQKAIAPATIAVGTNNDMDVNAATGKAWALSVVNPLASYVRKYPALTIAGANDIEPGFSATYSASRSWLTGYLAAASTQFIFNGSADGCAWTVTNRGCNNGWTMAGLYTLAGGAAPTRTVNLPQVYNYTMADQWKFISLTGIGSGQPRINFGGPLTEYTACAQAGSCGSLGGNSAWARLWSNLQSQASLRVSSLPYSTDLRIDG